MKIEKTIDATTFVAILLAVPLALGMAAADGWVLCELWRWFVVPVFHLPDLRLAQGIGLSLIAAFMTHQVHYKPDPLSSKQERSYLLGLLLHPPVAYAMGFLVHWLGAAP